MTRGDADIKAVGQVVSFRTGPIGERLARRGLEARQARKIGRAAAEAQKTDAPLLGRGGGKISRREIPDFGLFCQAGGLFNDVLWTPHKCE